MSNINIDEKLVVARLLDKIKICKISNKVVSTDFLNVYKREIIKRELNRLKQNNYLFFGGFEQSEYKVLILYPEKFKDSFEIFKNNPELKDNKVVLNSINSIIKAIRIKLPKELQNKYEHRDYLSAVMKFGLVRERMGDILVHDDGAYIIVLSENAEYLRDSLKDLIRFKKSQIDVIDIDEIKLRPVQYEEIKISISSSRLDVFVSEICKLSRSSTDELLKNEKVQVNSKIEIKPSKEIKIGDILVIRGKGKYLVSNFEYINRKGKQIVIIKKYV